MRLINFTFKWLYIYLDFVIDTCRSTVAQQEAEIKKLKESLSVRNKRVIQLESQVGEAANQIAGRHSVEPSTIPDPATSKLEETLIRIMSKLEQPQPVITINNNQNGLPAAKPSQSNQSSQTSCNLCKCTTQPEAHLKPHIENVHVQSSTEPSDECSRNIDTLSYQQGTNSSQLPQEPGNMSTEQISTSAVTCEYCDRKFGSVPLLLEHTESEHAIDFLTCNYCKYECESKTHMTDHMEGCHAEEETNTSGRSSV